MAHRWQSFMAAVCADPHDNTPRLVFADWLEENGEPERAELIRVGIELEKLSTQERQVRGSPLRARLDKLFRPVGDKAVPESFCPWWCDLPKLPGVEWGMSTQGGFFNTAHFDSIKVLREQVEAVFAATPVTVLFVKRMSPKAAQELVGMDWIERLTGLGLQGPVGTEGIRAIARCPHLGRVRSLQIERGRIGDAGVAALAAATSLKNLEFLRIKGDRLTIEAVKSLCAAEKPPPKLTAVSGLGMALMIETIRHDLIDRFRERFPCSDWTF
jgi:uncharacterized protein (TIGR02996 family)